MQLKEFNQLSGSEALTAYREHKASLIEEKKTTVKFSDTVVSLPTFDLKSVAATKSDSGEATATSLDVTVVCNVAWFCDSHMDVLTDKAYDDSIAARGNTIPHIADHDQTSTAHVGDVKAVYTKQIPLETLGYTDSNIKSTTALVMETTIRKDYNEKVFQFYANKKINQHSIGLTYNEIKMAINSSHEGDKSEKAIWDEYYPSVINKDLVDKKGYFWIVPKVDVRENSCVLFGANSLTPTLTSGKADAVKSSTPTEGGLSQPSSPTTSLKRNITMARNLEEALIELAEKSAEIETLKANAKLEAVKAVKAEQGRVLGIFDAANTFGLDSSVALNAVKSGYSSEQAVTMFETVTTLAQKANPTPTDTTKSTLDVQVKTNGAGAAEPTLADAVAKSFELMKAEKAEQAKLFKGVN